MKVPLFVSLLLAAGTVPAQEAPQARAILERVAQANQAGRSYRAEFAGTLQNTTPGNAQKVALAGGIFSQPPDKLRVEVTAGPVQVLVVRNGAQGVIYDAADKQYTRVPASAFAALNPSTLDLSALFGNTVTDVQVARLGPDENVNFEGKEIRTYVIQTQSNRDSQGGIVSSTLWVDRTNYTVLRRRSTWTTHPPQLQGALETTTDFALTKLRFDPGLSGAEFSFTPPPGTREIAKAPRVGAIESTPRTAPPAKAGPAPKAGPERATVLGDSVPLYSKMSDASPVITVLHKDDVVTLDFSIGGSDGAWCSVTQVGEGGKSGNVRCDSLKKVVP